MPALLQQTGTAPALSPAKSPNNLPLLNSTPTPPRKPTTNSAPTTTSNTTSNTTFTLLRENVPKTKSLVSSAGDDSAAIGAHAEVQHAVSVTGEGYDLRHAGVLPDVDGVLGVAVGADEFRSSRAE